MRSKKQFREIGDYLIQHRRSRVFYFRKRVGDRLVRESLATQSLEQARLLRDLRLKELKADVAAAVDPVFAKGVRKVTFGELATSYLEKVNELPERELKERSKDHIAECVKVIERTFGGYTKPVRNITDLEVADWGNSLRGKYSGPRFNAMLTAFRKIMERAVLAKAIDSNPALRIKRAPVDVTNRGAVPSREEFSRLIETLKRQGWGRSVRAAKVVKFLAFTGLRINEARQILKSDVILRTPAGADDPDQSYGRIVVRAEITKRSGHEVPIFKETRPIVDEWVKKSARGEFLMPLKECYRALRRACAKLGIPTLSHHKLRHFFATHCCECGVDKAVVASWLGHKNAALVHLVYGHVRNEHKIGEVKKVSFGA